MHNIDFLIIVIFLLGSTALGLWQGRRNKSSNDYFMAGRTLPWITVMFSIVATETSVLTFISVPGLAYRGDWQFLQLALGYIVGRIFVSVFFLPIFFKSGITSIYEVLGKRFGSNIQKLASGIFMITRVLADGVRFLAVAVIVQLITGWSTSSSILIIGFITLIYTYSGGIRSVVLLDSMQFFLYLSGGIISIVYILSSSDVSIVNIINDLTSADKLKVVNLDWNIFSNPFAFLSAFVGGILLSFASHGADYMMVQRVLSTKNLSSARKAMVGSGIFVFIQFCIFLLAGSLIYFYFSGIELENDREFPTFIAQHLPVGIKGILLAGVLSSAMSTLSSSINSLASSTINDWVKKTKSLKLSRFASLVWAIILIYIASLFDEGNEALVIVGLQIASFTYGGLLSLFILAKSPRDFTSSSIAIGLISSILTVILLKYIGLAWTWFIAFAVLINICITYISDYIIKYRFKTK